MEGLVNLDEARTRAVRRRAAGVAGDFDPARLLLARRLAGIPRTRLAARVQVTPAAITQFEKAQSRPTLPVLEAMAEALAVPVDFFRAGHPVPSLAASGAHFRSLRSTTSAERESALAFGELALTVFASVETRVDFPSLALPDLVVSDNRDLHEAAALARGTREAMGLGLGPIPNVVRLLEVHGVVVIALDEASDRVDAFSHVEGYRPLVTLSRAKNDKARSRFDAPHELGHLAMHQDTEPGSMLLENPPHAFAAEFLTPATAIFADLPQRLDCAALYALKARWGVSVIALVVRAHRLGAFSDSIYRRALRELAAQGVKERTPLGPAEVPVLLPRAVELLGGEPALEWVAAHGGLPLGRVNLKWPTAWPRRRRQPGQCRRLRAGCAYAHG